jgi:lysophospholipase L1-like esterase
VPYADDLDGRAFDDPGFYTPEGHWTEAYAYAERGFRLAAANMRRLVHLCRERRIAVTLVVYPWRTNIARQERDHVQRRFWRAFAHEHGVRVVDLFPPFMEQGAAYEALFIDDDVHWNARGHALVAAQVLSQLQ